MIGEERAKEIKKKYFEEGPKTMNSLSLIKKMNSEDKEDFDFIMKYFKPEGTVSVLLDAIYTGKTSIVHKKLFTTINAVNTSYMQMHRYIGEFLDDLIVGKPSVSLYNVGVVKDCYDFHYIVDFKSMYISELKYALGSSTIKAMKSKGEVTLGDFLLTCKKSKMRPPSYNKVSKLLKRYVSVEELC